jgi:hypothetical protein
MNLKLAVKRSLKMCIDCDLNPMTVIVRAVKGELHAVVDAVIPDDDPEKPNH